MFLNFLFGWSRTHEYRVGNGTQPFHLIRKAKTLAFRHNNLTLIEIPLEECKEPHDLAVNLSRAVKKNFKISIALDMSELMILCN